MKSNSPAFVRNYDIPTNQPTNQPTIQPTIYTTDRQTVTGSSASFTKRFFNRYLAFTHVSPKIKTMDPNVRSYWECNLLKTHYERLLVGLVGRSTCWLGMSIKNRKNLILQILNIPVLRRLSPRLMPSLRGRAITS